jgi:hypothetical protein
MIRFSIGTKLLMLLDDEQAKAVLAKHLPGIVDSPQLRHAGNLSLEEVSQFVPDILTRGKLQEIDSDLRTLEARSLPARYAQRLPRPEHPRPDLRRERWLSLNGPWRFACDPDADGEHKRYHRLGINDADIRTIAVPYPWESDLSGVAARDYKGAAWYEREITIPPEWENLHAHLHFGAVDWSARVWLNGHLIAEHENGYLPFSRDLGSYLQPGETGVLRVRAYDIADAATPLGKQVPRWYTHSSGIWQSVWLEARPPSYVAAVRITPDIEREQAEVDLTLHVAESGRFIIRLLSADQAFPSVEQHCDLVTGTRRAALTLPVPAPRLWSPDSPHLYDLQVDLQPKDGGPSDRISTFFGMRSVGRAFWNGKEYEYILLNGKPVYLRGALDQAFHPDGIHSYPSDEAIRGDIRLAKDLGLNMLRCHIKINDPRYYYWADRLGLLIMYDLPSPAVDTPQMRHTMERTLRGAIARDYNHPCIFAWVLFNETWGLENQVSSAGQSWLADMVRLAQQLDPTRLVEDNSACRYDHVTTDINSWHYYINDYAQVREHVQRVTDETYPGSSFNFVGGEYVQGTQPLMNSEYGGISAAMGDLDISWAFKYQTTELRRHAKICGYVYTELTDVEWEHNGFVNYDRSRKEFGYDFFVPGMRVRDLNSPDLAGLDTPPCQTLPPGAEFAAPLFVSHFGPPMARARVRWQLSFVDRFGQRRIVQEDTWSMQARRFDVVVPGELRLTMPQENGLATIALVLEDEAGRVRCRNYVQVEVRSGPSPRLEQVTDGWVLRLAPGNYGHTSWPNPVVGPAGAKFSALGDGRVMYDLVLPPEIDLDRLQRMHLCFEAGSRAGLAKVDWPRQARAMTDYPQTEEEKKYPSDLEISVNGQIVGSTRLADDPCDARGALSHFRNYDPGSYGYLVELDVEGADLEAVRRTLVAARSLQLCFIIPAGAVCRGGLALYGETLGAYPVDPMLHLGVG